MLAGPRIEPGVQRMSCMDCAAGWATLRLRSPLSQSLALTDEESDQLLGCFRQMPPLWRRTVLWKRQRLALGS